MVRSSRSTSWIFGAAVALATVVLLVISFVSYASLESNVPSNPNSLFNLGTQPNNGQNKGNSVILVNVTLVQTNGNNNNHASSPVVGNSVFLSVLKSSPNQNVTPAVGRTGSDGIVSFTVSPGKYYVNTDYFGMAANATVTVTAMETQTSVYWTFFRVIANSFTIQFYDNAQTLTMIPGETIAAHIVANSIQKPLVAELFTVITRSSSLQENSSVDDGNKSNHNSTSMISSTSVEVQRQTLGLMDVLSYQHEGQNIWMTLTPSTTLDLTSLDSSKSPPSLAVYWVAESIQGGGS